MCIRDRGTGIHKGDHRTAADTAHLLVGGNTRRIRRCGGIHHDGYIGIDRKSGSFRSPQADLLLNGKGQDNVVFRNLPHQLQQQGAAGPVIQRTGFKQAALQFPVRAVEDYRVTGLSNNQRLDVYKRQGCGIPPPRL